jgi:hypothetical protein
MLLLNLIPLIDVTFSTPTLDFTHPMREDVKKKYFSTLLRGEPVVVLASRPLLVRGEDFGLTPGAPQSTTGIRIAVA